MKVENIAITLRKRSAWQAINLGCVMARAWYLPLWLSWALPAFVVTALVAVAFPGFSHWLPVLVFWWFKPLWDRGPLYIASRRLFGETVGLVSFVKALPRLYWRDAFWALTYRRLSPSRAYDMPVTILENLSGSRRRSRLDLLQREGSGPAFWALVMFLHIEVIIVYGIGAFVYLMVPEKYSEDFFQVFNQNIDITLLIQNILYVFAASLIGPFYSVSGFSQYICRRVNLEGWDIELQFKRLATRTLDKYAITKVSMSFLLCVGLFFAATQPLQAEPSDQAPEQTEAYSTYEESQKAAYRELVQEILAGDDFHRKGLEKGIRLKKSDAAEEDDIPDILVRFIEWLEAGEKKDREASSNTAGAFAMLLEILIWGAAIGLIVYLIVRFAPEVQRFVKTGKRYKEEELPPDELFGLDLRKESLPDTPDQEALKLWDAGQHREALSLLYRATLSLLINQHGVNFKKQDTENECCQKVTQSQKSAIANYFFTLTRAWQLLAYGHKKPADETVKTLCLEWQGALTDES